MGDSQGNPFINNPFMQGTAKKKSLPEPPVPEPQRRRQRDLSLEATERLRDLPDAPKPSASDPAAKKSPKSLSKPTKSASKSATKPSTKPRSRAKKKDPPQPGPLPSPSYTGNGYKVQVLAKIPLPTNTNMPSRDYLWFAVYPIIPRVGDCIFHDGRYFRVDAVFLYENTNAGWCADLEVSYYIRRH